MMREILERLMKYEWFGCNTEARKGLEKQLDQALSQIKSELLGKLPKDDYKVLLESNSYGEGRVDGFNSCLSQVKQIIEEA